MNKVLISACLLGNPVRYDGAAKKLQHAQLARLVAAGRAIAYCPEVAGGLTVPRPAAEIRHGDGAAVIAGQARVLTRDGDDVSENFLDGARGALELCRKHQIEVAVLTEFSPSCGSGLIYDGSFTRTRVAGDGVTAALLRAHGIRVFNQHQLEAALACLDQDGANANDDRI